MDDADFARLYGPFRPWTPAEAGRRLAGWDRPWWIAGGWSIDAFTGTSRPHHDIDIAILRTDARGLRAHLGRTYHCWAAGSGALRPLTDDEPEVPEWAGQFWVREHALAPWVADVLLSPDHDGAWAFGRDVSIVRPVEDVLWRDAEGVPYQRPEITLAFKAKHRRDQDDADLARAWPLLDPDARAWLLSVVGRLHPGHPWLEDDIR
jgi:hypothetical protein